jgi:2-(1,2-epoxy-1,2-dihydrophenyl)acetyl-CoA isomerase
MSVTIKREGSVAIVTLDRADKKNALTLAMRAELYGMFEDLAEDDDVRAIILRGAGTDFCAGADIKEMGATTPRDFVMRTRRLHRITRAIASIKKPVIAAVDGVAIGAGWSIALSCDFVVTTARARFAFTFGRIGYAPDAGAVWHLVQQIGQMKAKEIIYSGRFIDGAEALSLGLALELVPADDLMDRAMAMANRLAAGPPIALAMAKRQFEAASALSLDQFLELEAPMQPLLGQTADHREGLCALAEKRAPAFIGE